MDRVTITAMEARNQFRRVLDIAASDRVVVITRYNVPRAVMISVERFHALSGDSRERVEHNVMLLDTLAAEFDAMLEKMQTPEAQIAARKAFNASTEELGRAAAAAARQTRTP